MKTWYYNDDPCNSAWSCSTLEHPEQNKEEMEQKNRKAGTALIPSKDASNGMKDWNLAHFFYIKNVFKDIDKTIRQKDMNK